MSESMLTHRLCDKGGSLHYLSAHSEREFPHNPWSERCVKRLPNEPSCPDARCTTCDGARAAK